MVKLVMGVGWNDGKYPAKVRGRTTKQYTLWNSLLRRCYYLKYHDKFPTYIGCSISENFKSYSYFYEWCQSQVGFGREGFHLDKDLIQKGNKVYSEKTCLFLPNLLNVLLTSRKTHRGALPIGVCAYKDKFAAQCCSESSSRHIGYFNTPEEAFAAYKEVKEAFIKTQAEKWKNFIDPRAYQALMAYEVSITD